MKNQDAERQISLCCNGAAPYDYNYPEIDLTPRSSAVAYENAFYTPCAEEYAQDTTTWD